MYVHVPRPPSPLGRAVVDRDRTHRRVQRVHPGHPKPAIRDPASICRAPFPSRADIHRARGPHLVEVRVPQAVVVVVVVAAGDDVAAGICRRWRQHSLVWVRTYADETKNRENVRSMRVIDPQDNSVKKIHHSETGTALLSDLF